MKNKDIVWLCIALLITAGAFWLGGITASNCPDQLESKERTVQPAQEDPNFSKLDDCITVNYLSPKDIEKVQKFLSGMKKESPLMSFKIKKGPVKFYSGKQLDAIGKAQ